MAPMARNVVSDTLSLIFFGETLCELAPGALIHFYWYSDETYLAD